MKKTYLARRNRLLTGRNFSWGLWALVFSVLVLFLRLIAPNVFFHLFEPVAQVSGKINESAHAFFLQFAESDSVHRENALLSETNSKLANENRILTQKLADVTSLLGASAFQNTGGILAGVTTRPPESPYDTLVLNAGTADGVIIGMEVFGKNGSPVGTVTALTKDFSRVTLFSRSGVVTLGWVGQSHIPLKILGTGGGTMRALVPREANVVTGAVVYIPGPGMVPLGTVERIDSDPLSPGVTLHIVPAVNIFSITWVVLHLTDDLSQETATTTSI